MTTDRIYALWMLPCAVESERFGRLIDALAHGEGTPPFTPHVTLISGIGDAERALLCAQEIAASHTPFHVRPTHLEHLEMYFRALTIRLEPGEILTALYDRCRPLGEADGEFTPHLSLQYQHPEAFDRAVFDRCPADSLRPFLLDRINLLDASGDVGDWRSITELRLAGGDHA